MKDIAHAYILRTSTDPSVACFGRSYCRWCVSLGICDCRSEVGQKCRILCWVSISSLSLVLEFVTPTLLPRGYRAMFSLWKCTVLSADRRLPLRVVKLSALWGHFLSTEVIVHCYGCTRYNPLHRRGVIDLELDANRVTGISTSLGGYSTSAQSSPSLRTSFCKCTHCSIPTLCSRPGTPT